MPASGSMSAKVVTLYLNPNPVIVVCIVLTVRYHARLFNKRGVAVLRELILTLYGSGRIVRGKVLEFFFHCSLVSPSKDSRIGQPLSLEPHRLVSSRSSSRKVVNSSR